MVLPGYRVFLGKLDEDHHARHANDGMDFEKLEYAANSRLISARKPNS